jgi:hypothetical protein
MLPEAACDRQSGSTMQAYFPSQAADADSSQGLLTQPPNSQDNDTPESTTDLTEAAPRPAPTLTTTGPSQGADDKDDDDEDAVTAKPAAASEPHAKATGDP